MEYMAHFIQADRDQLAQLNRLWQLGWRIIAADYDARTGLAGWHILLERPLPQEPLASVKP